MVDNQSIITSPVIIYQVAKNAPNFKTMRHTIARLNYNHVFKLPNVGRAVRPLDSLNNASFLLLFRCEETGKVETSCIILIYAKDTNMFSDCLISDDLPDFVFVADYSSTTFMLK